MLLRSGDNLFNEMKSFVESSSSFMIISPFIKLSALKIIIDESDACEQIIVRWKANDIISNVSDLEVYDYCKEKNIALFINPRIHLKAIIDNFQRCVLGSSNITNRGLGIANDHNYELGTEVRVLSDNDILYFQEIIQSSKLVTDNWFKKFSEYINSIEVELPAINEYPFNDIFDHFLISALPMSFSMDELAMYYLHREATSDEAKRCAVHDMVLYNIPANLSHEEMMHHLRDAFFSHPFIVAISSYMLKQNGELYFGKAKTWIQDNCANVPTPRRWELTTNTQILYRWFVELGLGEYAIDIPSRKSQRLFITSR